MKTKQTQINSGLSLPYNNGNPSGSFFMVRTSQIQETVGKARQRTRTGTEIPVPTRKAVLGDLKRVARAPKRPK